MNQAIPLYVILIVLAGAAVLYFFYRADRALKSAGRTLDAAIESQGQLTSSLAEVKKTLEAFSQHLSVLPKMLEAVARIGDAQLEIMKAQQPPAPPPAAPPRRNSPMPPRDVESANAEYDINQIMRSDGVTREEAMLRLNGANEDSVWGGHMFSDWRRE